MPFSSFAGTVDPETDCPKKKNKQPEDSVGIYESENKVLEEEQTQVMPKPKQVAVKTTKKPSVAKTYNKVDTSDEVVDGDPNSAMSFNFIYYIIDKFKFTDPLE